MTDVMSFYEPSSYFFGLLLILGIVWICRCFINWYKRTSHSYIQYRVMDQEIAEPSRRDFRTCAVIGGTGFIGSHLVDGLLTSDSQSYRVFVLSRNIPAKAKRHPGVAAYVQVDMRDYGGLVKAFANVDTVFHFGAVIPNAVVNSYEAVWSGNKDGAIAVIDACKTAGVKNLIYLGGFIQENRQDRHHAFSLSKSEASRLILNAHEEQGLNTCVANVSIIFGQGDKFTEGFITGKATKILNIQHEYYFMYVKSLIPLLTQLEEKLAAGDERIAGKAIDLPGEKMTSKEFFSLPEWKQRPTFISVNVARMMAYLNSLCARLINYAPLGMALCPQIIDELNSPTKNNISPDRMLATFGLKQVPCVREDIKTAVADMSKHN